MPDARQLEKRQRVLADFGDFALRSDDLDAVLTQACRLVAEALGTRHAKVLEIEHESRTLFVRAGVGWGMGIVGRLRLQMADHSSETFSIDLGEPVITNDLAVEDRFDFPAYLKEAGVKALVNVPVFLPGGMAFGLLQVDASEPRVFDDDDSQFLRTYATILGPVIDRLLKMEALRAAEMRFRSIVEAARDYAIFLTDCENRITDWLPGAEAVFGWTAEEAVGQSASMLFTPEDRQMGVPEAEQNFAREQGSARDVRWHLRKDGSRVFIEGTVAALHNGNGQPHGFQRIGQDVTRRRLSEQALRESEEKYRSLFDSIDEGFCVVEVLFDPACQPIDYLFLETNDAFESQTGLADAVGKRMRQLAPEHEQRWFEIYGLIAMSGEPQRFELPAEALGRWYDVYAFRIGDPDQKRVAILFNDIGERKRAEGELREREERQAFLLKLSDALRPLGDAGEIQATTTRLLGAHMGVDRSMYADVTGEPGAEVGTIRGQFIRPAVPGWPAPPSFPDHFAFENFGADVMARRYSGEGLAVADVNVDAGFDATDRAAWAGVGVQAAIVAPLVKNGRLVAELGVHAQTARAWSEAEISLVREVGERTWAAAERARAEAALRESEERYRSLFNAVSQGLAINQLVRDANGRVVDARYLDLNPAYEAQTGFNRDDAIGRTASEIFPLIEPFWLEMAGRVVETGRPEHIEHFVADSESWFSFDMAPFKGTDQFVVLYDNITERKRAEAALRESEERQRLTVELVPALLWSASRDGQEISLNEGWLSYTGQSEFETQSAGWLDVIHPDDMAASRAAFENSFAAGEPLEREQRIRKAGDGWRWHLVRQVPVRDDNGTITRWFGAAVDIHESKLAEQAVKEAELRLQTLVEGVPQLVWRAVHAGRWTWASPQWTDYTGQVEAASYDRGWLEPVHPDDRERVLAAWDGAIESGDFRADYRIGKVGDGRYRWFQTRATPVRDDTGAIIEWLGTSTDVDDIRAMQEAQTVMVAELQHRTRNLIAVVRSIALQTMAQTGPNETFRDEFNHRLEALARVQGLLSRSDEEPITIDALIRMELDALGASAAPGRFKIAGPPARIRNAVVQTLALALHELATNARKYGALSGDEGRLQVIWRTHADAKGERLLIEWTETGGQLPDPHGDTRRGYGRELIEQALPYTLNAKTSFEHNDFGLRCTIDIPLKRTGSGGTTA